MGRFWRVLFGIFWLVATVYFLVNLYEIKSIKDDPEWLRGIGFFLGGVGVAPLALLLAHGRTESLKAQIENDKQKNVTEAFAKSVELLGNARSTARQGGIYALGRIAEDNPETYQKKVMDIVASYIRQESRDSLEQSLKEKGSMGNTKTIEEVIKEKKHLVLQYLQKHYNMNMDVEAAVAVIRQRDTGNDKEGHHFDLSNSFLVRADFSNTDLSNANFSNSYLIDCVFDNTILKGANFAGTDLTDSSLTQEQVNDVETTDEDTVLPKGIKPAN